MNCFLIFAGSGPLVVLTSHDSVTDPKLLEKLKAKGIGKFLAFEVPLGLARERYGAHFMIVERDLSEKDDLRVLDYDGQRAFKRFRFRELGQPIEHEGT
jgi:hypothetical protein